MDDDSEGREPSTQQLLSFIGRIAKQNADLLQELNLSRNQPDDRLQELQVDAENLNKEILPLIPHNEEKWADEEEEGDTDDQDDEKNDGQDDEKNDGQDGDESSCWSLFCSCCVNLHPIHGGRVSQTIADKPALKLPEDTFSFLISANWKSKPFRTGILVFVLKTAIFGIFAYNNVDWTKNFNKLDIPVAVDIPVSLSQVVAFFLSVYGKNDLVGAFTTYFRGYNSSIKDAFGPDARDDPERGGGHSWQWGLSIALSILDGLVGLVVTFLLVVKSGTVLDVLLNFAAVEFVAEIDETAFYFAEMGFFGLGHKTEARFIKTAEYHPRKFRKPESFVFYQRKHSLYLMVGVVIISYLILEGFQQQGSFSAKTIIVQFDDQIRPDLGAHSGFYSLKTTWQVLAPHLRFQYTEDREGGGRFAYCLKRREWRFAVEYGDHCDDTIALAKSIKTQSFNLLDVATETWFVKRTTSDHFIPMPDFFMDIGCDRDADCGGTAAGQCRRQRCECEEDRFGLRCEYSHTEACTDVQIDERFEPVFPSVRVLSTSYTAVGNKAIAYERPIFYNNNTNDVILFTGTSGRTVFFGTICA